MDRIEAVQIKELKSIPVSIPCKEIMRRLKFHNRKTAVPVEQMYEVDRLIGRAAGLCEPAGRYAVTHVTATDSEVFPRGMSVIKSRSLAKLLAGSVEAVFMAVTVGSAVVERIQDLARQGKMAEAVVFDAVASEMADAAMDFVHDYLRRSGHRFGKTATHRYSPGFGDLTLHVQREIYAVLRLDELGLRLSENCMLLPEKSVTAIAGIEGVQ